MGIHVLLTRVLTRNLWYKERPESIVNINSSVCQHVVCERVALIKSGVSNLVEALVSRPTFQSVCLSHLGLDQKL